MLRSCSKIFERILYNRRSNFLIHNNLFSQYQSGFNRRDSCISQLISITHNILNMLDDGYRMRLEFLDISKAFVKV